MNDEAAKRDPDSERESGGRLDLPADAPNPWIAYLLPFGLFMVLTSLEPTLEEQGLYEIGYAIKIVAVACALAWGRKAYPKFAQKGIGLGLGLGAALAAVWIGLTALDLEASIREHLPGWLQAERTERNPFDELNGAAWAAVLFVGCRLIGLALIVPLLEEVFWRGFLMPYLIDSDFIKVPPGTYSHLSFGFVTVAFVAVHPEWIAALIWGVAINVLYYRTRNLWACIVAHMTTNALLGVWILSTGSWELW